MKEECVQKPEKNINLKRKARLTFSFIQVDIKKKGVFLFVLTHTLTKEENFLEPEPESSKIKIFTRYFQSRIRDGEIGRLQHQHIRLQLAVGEEVEVGFSGQGGVDQPPS